MKTRSIECSGAILCIFAAFAFAAEYRGDDTVKLGVVTACSGAYKTLIGDVVLEGVEFAVDEINEHGGLLGRKVEIVPIDSQHHDAAAARENVAKAIREHNIQFFQVESSSLVGSELLALMENERVLWYSSIMAGEDLTGPNASRYFFRCGHNTSMAAKAVAANIVEQGYEKVFVLAQDYSFGRQASDAFIREVQSLNPNVQVVGMVLRPLTNKDFSPYVSQIIDSGAQAVVTTDFGGDLVLLLKTARQMGFDGKFAAYYLDRSTYMKTLGDSAAIGHRTSESYLVTIPTEANLSFVERFYQEKGRYPEQQGKVYTATMFWAEAVSKAGSLKVDEVIEAWEGLTYDGPAGKWTMRAFDHQTLLPIWTAEVVRDNPYFDHAYLGTATMLSAEAVTIPVEKTGAPGFDSR